MAVAAVLAAAAVAAAVPSDAALPGSPAGAGYASYRLSEWAQSNYYGMKLVGAFPTGHGLFVGTVVQSNDAVACPYSSLGCDGDPAYVGPFVLSGTSAVGHHHLSATCSGTTTGDWSGSGVPYSEVLTLDCQSAVDGAPTGASTLAIDGSTTIGASDSPATGSTYRQQGTFAEIASP